MNYQKDLAQRAALDGLPLVDKDYHVAAAKVANGEPGWKDRLKRAVSTEGKLTEDEYFYYQLYDPSIAASELANFVGKQKQNLLHRHCNNPIWLALSHDKALFELVLKGAGIPAPRTLAVCTKSRRHGFEANLRSAADLRTFLTSAPTPLFCKPIDGMYSIGAMAITGIDGREVEFKNGATRNTDQVWDYMSNMTGLGYLIQEYLVQDSELAEWFGSTICTARCLVSTSSIPKIESAVLKIASDGADADNFWRPSNMLAPIDIMDGKLGRAIANTGNAFQTIEKHRDTAHHIEGRHLGDWSKLVDLVLDAATLFPGVRTQSWDIALTDSGPTMVEFNWGGDLNLHQLAHRKGILTPSFRGHLERCGASAVLAE